MLDNSQDPKYVSVNELISNLDIKKAENLNRAMRNAPNVWN